MKKPAIIILTIFTMAATSLYGCSEAKANRSYDYKAENIENINTLETEENSEQERECPKCPDKPEFPDTGKHRGKPTHPYPHRPHIRPDGKTPQPRNSDKNK